MFQMVWLTSRSKENGNKLVLVVTACGSLLGVATELCTETAIKRLKSTILHRKDGKHWDPVRRVQWQLMFLETYGLLVVNVVY